MSTGDQFIDLSKRGQFIDLSTGDQFDLSTGDQFDLSTGDKFDFSTEDQFDSSTGDQCLPLRCLPERTFHKNHAVNRGRNFKFGAGGSDSCIIMMSSPPTSSNTENQDKECGEEIQDLRQMEQDS